MAIFDWKQSLNNRPTYGPTVSNAQKINPTPQEKLSILQYYKKKKNLFETNTKPSIMQNNGFKSFEAPKPQVPTFSEPRDSAFDKLSSNYSYKPPQQEETKVNSFVGFQQPKPISFPKIQSPFKPTPQQRSWDIEKNESEEKKISPNYFQAKSLDNLDDKNEIKKPEVTKYSEPKQSTFYSDYLKKQKNPYDNTKSKFPLYNPYKQWDPKPVQSYKLTDREFHEKIPIKKWKDDFGDLLKKQQSSNPNEKNSATSNIKIARSEQQEILDKYHSLLPSRKQTIDTKIKELDESFNDKNNLYAGGQKLFDFVESLNKEHLTSNKLKNFAEFVKESRQKQLNAAKIEESKQPIINEQAPKTEEKQVERKVLTRTDIVLDDNDKKLSRLNQEKLIDEKLKWHNAKTDNDREMATQSGKQIREADKITSNNFSEYSTEKQKQYLTELSQKSNIKLNEKGDMVKVLQKVLPQIGFSDIKEATGNYSEKTRAAIASLVELVTGEKSSGSKIGNNEKAKLVQILSEIANGDTTIANKLKDRYNKNFNQERFDEVIGKNKVDEMKEEDKPSKDIELNNNNVDNSRFPNTSIDEYYIIDGTKYKNTITSDLRTASFIARHPIVTLNIGKADPGKGKTDITNNAIRFSTNELRLQENEKNPEGSQVNAFRHTLWQATIAKRYGVDIAKEVGDAHEEHPDSLDSIKDLNRVRFKTLNLADEVTDLLNNKIGRSLGNIESDSMKEIAIETLNYYHNTGLFIAVKRSDGTYSIVQEKLSDEQFKIVNDRLNLLDNNGFDKKQADYWNQRFKDDLIVPI